MFTFEFLVYTTPAALLLVACLLPRKVTIKLKIDRK